MTDDQWECALMFARVVGGFHHVCGEFKACGSGVRIHDHPTRWATFDFDRLTRLVVLAHDEMIRVELAPSGPGRVGFSLWKRHTRTGRVMERHPTIHDAVAIHSKEPSQTARLREGGEG
jgi:hypothetical protein